MNGQYDLQRLLDSPHVAHVELHEVLPSTNDLALLRAAERGLATPALIVAAQQTAGRGRGANRWWSSAGAVLFSLVLEPSASAIDVQRWPRISLAAAVAVCEVVESLAGASNCGIRWPNDVFLAGRKVAGILAEVPNAGQDTPRRLVLGVGLNVNNSLATAPVEIRTVGTSLVDATGRRENLTEVLLASLERLDRRLAQLAAADEDLSEQWQRRCLLHGRRVELVAGNRRIAGRCQGTDHQGALVIETDGGTERFYGGVLAEVD